MENKGTCTFIMTKGSKRTKNRNHKSKQPYACGRPEEAHCKYPTQMECGSEEDGCGARKLHHKFRPD
jgi:hypothetical protein